MTRLQRIGSLAARLALSAIFVNAGLGKLGALGGTAAFIASKGLPEPVLLAVAAGVAELGGGLLLAAGLGSRWAALALAAFLVPTTVLFHSPFGLTGLEQHLQVVQIYKNLAIAGGLLAIASYGGGALSLDARLHVGTGAPKVRREALT